MAHTEHEVVRENSRDALFVAAWERVLMIHFEVDAQALQRDVPFELHLWNGRAFVSLVAFTMRGMKPCLGGRLGAVLFWPIATHHFLNVRTYVRHGDESGIHFITEWLSNRLAVLLGPLTFALPYRFGRINYNHDSRAKTFSGGVTDSCSNLALEFRASAADASSEAVPCDGNSLDSWLMERYLAFNSVGQRKRCFRVWHPPWKQIPMTVDFQNLSLLRKNWTWFNSARLVRANFSPGFQTVLMGWPRRIYS